MLTSGVVNLQLLTVNKKVHSLSHGAVKVLAIKSKIIEPIHSVTNRHHLNMSGALTHGLTCPA
jgi:hypothetical protein